MTSDPRSRPTRLDDADLLALVAVSAGRDRPARLTRTEVVAAGHAAWTWRTVSADLHELIGRPDRLGGQ